MNTIKTTAEIDSDGWLTVHTRLSEKMQPGPIEAVIVLQPAVSSEQKGIIDCIRELRKLGPIAGIEDPVQWQRSGREERPLRRGN